MTATFLTDEHVPSVFITTLRSSGYDVETATGVFGEGTDDERLLEYCAEDGRVLITHVDILPRLKTRESRPRLGY